MRHADGFSPQRPLTVVTAAHDPIPNPNTLALALALALKP